LEIRDQNGQYHVPDPELVELGEEILRLFCEMRPRYVPGRVNVRKRNLIKFYQAAELCRERGQTAAQFVKSQLEGMAQVGRFWPSAIASPAFAVYQTDHNMSYGRYVRYYKSQLNVFEDRAILYGARTTLLDPTAQFSPLFRYVIASLYGFEDIKAEAHDAAMIELDGAPAARDLFADLLRNHHAERSVQDGAL
jgi:hypothetical protein